MAFGVVQKQKEAQEAASHGAGMVGISKGKSVLLPHGPTEVKGVRLSLHPLPLHSSSNRPRRARVLWGSLDLLIRPGLAGVSLGNTLKSSGKLLK